jgi:hypothetical protein
MATDAGPDENHVQRAILSTVSTPAERIVDLSPGYSGSKVYAADVPGPGGRLPCIATFTPDWGDPEQWDFETTYALLQQHHILLPQLHSALAPQPDFPIFLHRASIHPTVR